MINTSTLRGLIGNQTTKILVGKVKEFYPNGEVDVLIGLAETGKELLLTKIPILLGFSNTYGVQMPVAIDSLVMVIGGNLDTREIIKTGEAKEITTAASIFSNCVAFPYIAQKDTVEIPADALNLFFGESFLELKSGEITLSNGESYLELNDGEITLSNGESSVEMDAEMAKITASGTVELIQGEALVQLGYDEVVVDGNAVKLGDATANVLTADASMKVTIGGVPYDVEIISAGQDKVKA